MVVRLPEHSLPAAFAGSCTCQHRGGCDRPGAVPLQLAEHVDFIEGIGAWIGDLRQRSETAKRDYNPANRNRAAKRKSQMARELERVQARGKGPWYPDCLKEEATPKRHGL